MTSSRADGRAEPTTGIDQYRLALQTVLDQGVWVDTPQGPRALTAMQVTMRFRPAVAFPMITERSVAGFWRKPIGEICAFINGATSAATLEAYGCDWWSGWVTEEKTAPRGIPQGEIGPGSYGAAFHDFPGPGGERFDQFANLVVQLRSRPNDRTHFVSPWIPYYQFRNAGLGRKTTVSPCHGWVHARVLGGRLHLHMFQRAGDLPIGVPSNMIQYGALHLMLSSLVGLPAGTLYHTISDAHIYADQMDAVQEMLRRSPRPLPTVALTPRGAEVQDIHAFRSDHFEVRDYDPHPPLRIPVAL